jgi:hypothetical protein
MNAWTMFYPMDWELDEVTNYSAFIYLIQFPDTNEYYFGIKQVYKKIKNASEIKSTSQESNWEGYTSSSKYVKAMIADGMPYKKQILWCYKSLQEAALAETALISIFGSDHLNINKAVMVKTRLKKDSGEQFKIIQRIVGDLI